MFLPTASESLAGQTCNLLNFAELSRPIQNNISDTPPPTLEQQFQQTGMEVDCILENAQVPERSSFDQQPHSCIIRRP